MNIFKDELIPSLNLDGNSLGRTYDTLYPLTRMCPVYLSSRVCTLMPFVEDIDRPEGATDVDGVGSANSERYDFGERGWRLSVRAAL